MPRQTLPKCWDAKLCWSNRISCRNRWESLIPGCPRTPPGWSPGTPNPIRPIRRPRNPAPKNPSGKTKLSNARSVGRFSLLTTIWRDICRYTPARDPSFARYFSLFFCKFLWNWLLAPIFHLDAAEILVKSHTRGIFRISRLGVATLLWDRNLGWVAFPRPRLSLERSWSPPPPATPLDLPMSFIFSFTRHFGEYIYSNHTEMELKVD